jgi:isocitrate dehydrogenase
MQSGWQKLAEPGKGTRISVRDGRLQIPDDPIIPFIEGDGIGPDVWNATRLVLDRAVAAAYGGRRRIEWLEILAGDKALAGYGTLLPEDTLKAIAHYVVAIKGPLTTPVGKGFRSLNVTFRQVLDLYACVRPVRWIPGVPAPVTHPEKLDVVIFRENTEDVYAGIEWPSRSREALKLLAFVRELNPDYGSRIRDDSGIGIKPISETGTRRIVRKALDHALARGLSRATVVHKGNIMKYTEGAFREWAYQTVREEYPGRCRAEDDGAASGAVTVNDRIADSMFQQILLRPDEYQVLVTPNLNGDYLSDACAACVGGLGMAPGANIGDHVALFEATHGSAPKYSGQDKVNPGSLVLSGAMMLEYLGWKEASTLIARGLERTVEQKTVTYDLARQVPGAETVSTSRFAELIARNMG